jgi:hypothetical protein
MRESTRTFVQTLALKRREILERSEFAAYALDGGLVQKDGWMDGCMDRDEER